MIKSIKNALRKNYQNINDSTLTNATVIQAAGDVNYGAGKTFCQYIKDSNNIERNYFSKFSYDSNTVGFFGRKKEWGELVEFCNRSEKLLWWAITGQGGSGKSRLSYEFLNSLADKKAEQVSDSWITRNIRWPVFYKWFSSPNCIGFGSIESNMIFVVDYVHAFERQIGEWVSFIEQNMGLYSGKIRIILVERIPQIINTNTDQISDPDWFRFYSDGVCDSRLLWELCHRRIFLDLKSLDEYAAYSIIEDYAYRNGVTIMRQIIEALIKHTKEVNNNKISPLYLLFITDAWINYKDILKWDRDKILEYFAIKEERRIRDCFSLSSEPNKKAIAILYMIATITEELKLEDIRLFLDAEMLMVTGVSETELMTELYNNPYTSKGYLYGIEPDLVGEYYVLYSIEQHDRDHSILKLFDFLVKQYPESAIRFILRFSSDFKKRLTQLGIYEGLLSYVRQIGRSGQFTILNDEGREINCEILFTFDSEETGKSYVVFTDNSVDDEGPIKAYANIYDSTGSDNSLLPIETDKEWSMIEKLLVSLQEEMANEEDRANITSPLKNGDVENALAHRFTDFDDDRIEQKNPAY